MKALDWKFIVLALVGTCIVVRATDEPVAPTYTLHVLPQSTVSPAQSKPSLNWGGLQHGDVCRDDCGALKHPEQDDSRGPGAVGYPP